VAIQTFVDLGTLASVMPQERSLDIDTELDCMFFEFLMRSLPRDEGERFDTTVSINDL